MRSALAVALLLMTCSSCATPTANTVRADYVNNRSCNFYGWSFCIYNAGLGRHISTNYGPDFAIYNFIYDDVNVLTIFEDVAMSECLDSEVTKVAVGKSLVEYKECNTAEFSHREFMNPKIDFPRYIYMVSPVNLRPSLKSSVESAIASMRYCRPSDASMICD